MYVEWEDLPEHEQAEAVELLDQLDAFFEESQIDRETVEEISPEKN